MSKAISLLFIMRIIIFFTNCVTKVCNLLGSTSWVMMLCVGWSQLAWNSSRLCYHHQTKKILNNDLKRAWRQKWNTTRSCKTIENKFLNNDFKRVWKQKWNTTNICKDADKFAQWFGNKCKTTKKKSWIMISKELGDKNETPHVSTKLYNKNS